MSSADCHPLRRLLIPSLALAAAAIALYLPSLSGGFVYDSRAVILGNPHVHDLRNLWDVLSLRVLSQDVPDNTRPVYLVSVMLDVAAWGDSPLGFHLTNVLLHAVNAVLLFLLLARLPGSNAVAKGAQCTPGFRADPSAALRTGGAALPQGQEAYGRSGDAEAPPRPQGRDKHGGCGDVGAPPRWREDAGSHATHSLVLAAAFGTLLFAVNPAASDAVCMPSFRKDLLVAFFVLLGLNLLSFYPGRRSRDSWLLGAGTVLALLAAVGAKESGIAGPLLAALYVLLFRRREWSRAWAAVLASAALAVGLFLAARFLLAPGASAIFLAKPAYPGGSFAEMLKIEPRILAYQAETLVAPWRLCADQGPYTMRHISLAAAWVLIAALALATAVAARWDRRILFAAGLFLLPLGAVSNILPIYQPLADRYLYVPSAALGVLAAALVFRPGRAGPRLGACAAVLGAACAVAFALATLGREAVWNDECSLWQDTLNRNPFSITAANNLGFALYDRHAYANANRAWERALQISGSRHADSWAGLAIALEKLGRQADAQQAYAKAVSLDPVYADPHRLVQLLLWEPSQAADLERIAARVRKRGAAD